MTAAPERAGRTRDRIIQAALETLEHEGFAETTARSIASRGGFNQALIFYHFGSVGNLLLEAYARRSEEQVARYREAAADVASPSDLVEIARRLHAEDMEQGHITAVVQLMAAASDSEQGGALLDRFESWISIVEEALGRATAGSPVAAVAPVREAAYAISCMFLGVELLARLDPERSEAAAVFDMLSAIARLAEAVGPALLASGAIPAPAAE